MKINYCLHFCFNILMINTKYLANKISKYKIKITTLSRIYSLLFS